VQISKDGATSPLKLRSSVATANSA
jgi:hypothetical protein